MNHRKLKLPTTRNQPLSTNRPSLFFRSRPAAVGAARTTKNVIDDAVVAGTAEGRLELAKDAAEYAKSIAPEETGEYANSIAARRDGSRVIIRFGAAHSNLVEYGSVNNPEYGVVRKTIEHYNNT